MLAGTGDESGVAHGEILLEFVEAMLGRDEARQDRARTTVWETLGERALVDAAGIVASFNAVVILADGSGIPLEDYKAVATETLRADLGIDTMAG